MHYLFSIRVVRRMHAVLNHGLPSTPRELAVSIAVASSHEARDAASPTIREDALQSCARKQQAVLYLRPSASAKLVRRV